MPPKQGQRHATQYDHVAYRERNQIERAIAWLKRFRRIATRYDKRRCHYAAWLEVAVAMTWIR
ncbi:transposase [Deinococcus arcticus]|uniref:transposase n=1 Tax=Deinococcus arcticus TaxID=2136176 RepID=UPI0038BC5CD0